MAISGKKTIQQEAADNIFWTTMADLMLGLAIIFMTLFVFAMTGFTQDTVKIQQTQIQAAQEIVEKLKEAEIDAEVDKLTGNVKISNLELFDLNSYTLSAKGKKYLDKFIPIYIDTIYAKDVLKNGIANIVIEGHTDSQSYAGLKTKDQQFAKNMELSLLRANSVAQYAFKTNYDKKHSEALRKMLVVEGRSFSDPVLVDGKEDFAKSRRVEMKIRVKANNFASALGLNFGGD